MNDDLNHDWLLTMWAYSSGDRWYRCRKCDCPSWSSAARERCVGQEIKEDEQRPLPAV